MKIVLKVQLIYHHQLNLLVLSSRVASIMASLVNLPVDLRSPYSLVQLVPPEIPYYVWTHRITISFTLEKDMKT